MIDPTQQAAQSAPASGAPAAPGAAAGPVVCIAAQPDGTFLVYTQDEDPIAGQPAPDADTAAQLAVSMLSGGASDDQGANSSTAQDADALFQGGFNSVRNGGN